MEDEMEVVEGINFLLYSWDCPRCGDEYEGRHDPAEDPVECTECGKQFLVHLEFQRYMDIQ